MTRNEISNILKELRISSGFTQKEIAEKLNKKQQTIASWESAQSQPDANTLFILCSLYGTTVDKAFGFTSESISNIKSNELLQTYYKLSPKYQDYLLLMSKELLILEEHQKES